MVPVCMREYTTLSFIRPACGLIYSRCSLFPLGNVDNIFLFPSGASPLWFLTSLFTSYVCFLAIHRYQGFRLLIIASYIVLTIALSFLPILLPWSLDTAPAGALFIYVGYQLKEQKFFSNRLWKLLFISVIILPVYYYLISVNGGVNMSVRDYGKIPVLSPLVFLILGLLGSIVYCIFCIILERSKLVAFFCLSRKDIPYHPLQSYARLWIFCHSIAQTFIFVLRRSSFIKNRFHSKHLCSNNICHDIGKVFPMEKAACTENKLTYIRQIVSEM